VAEAIDTDSIPPRKLIICCDGTWNQRDSAKSATNVAKMARAISPIDKQGISQLIYYHPGVGTGNWLDRMLGGGFGLGLSGNIRSAYAFLVDNYRPGDEIFLFGFSRGAFTARSLAGLVGLIGVLQKIDMENFGQIYEIYQSRTYRKKIFSTDFEQAQNEIRKMFPDGEANGKNRKILEAIGAADRPNFLFVGVWDTVGALGMPWPFSWIGGSKIQFHDTDINENITYAYHALAIDERRGSFKPTLWTRPIRSGQARRQALEQVWFSGVHSNVGGGYDDPGLSDIAFLWMVAKAASAAEEKGDRPLAFEEGYLREKIDHGMGALIDSRKRLFKMLPQAIRQVAAPVKEGSETCERIHRSVFDRCDCPPPGKFKPFPYRPDNIARFLEPRDSSLIAELSEFELKYRQGATGDAK
jgi:uncharacterized protein (DUF2235 family)